LAVAAEDQRSTSAAPAPILVVTGPSGAGKTTVGRLVAATFERSAHIQTDHFMTFVASGWVEPQLADAAHQNHVLGGAVTAAALQFATGGYTVVLDGHIFPEGLDGLAHHSARRGVTLHYAILRPDLATCLTRVQQRRQGDPEDLESFTRLHARFADLGDHEANVIDTTGPPDEVAARVLAAFSTRHLEVITPPDSVDATTTATT
jgi:thymidylate kinase